MSIGDHTPSAVDRATDLPALSIRRPWLVVVLNLLIVIAGLGALRGVELRELPNVDRPIVAVRADFPGAAPETLDAEVTRVLEGAASRVPGVVQVRAGSEEGNLRVILEFSPDVNLVDAANDVRDAISRVESQLPAGVQNLSIVKADADAEPEAPLREDLDVGGLLRDERGLTLREDDDPGDQLEDRGHAGEVGEEDERVGESGLMVVRTGEAARAVPVGADDVVVGDVMVVAGGLGGLSMRSDRDRVATQVVVRKHDADAHGNLVQSRPPRAGHGGEPGGGGCFTTFAIRGQRVNFEG